MVCNKLEEFWCHNGSLFFRIWLAQSPFKLWAAPVKNLANEDSYIFWNNSARIYYINRLWKVYTYALSGENMGPILFPCWYDGATCLDQESRGVDPPTPPGGYIGGHNPPYIPQKCQSQRAAEIFPLMEILIFQLISTPNDLKFNICQIHRGDISIFPKMGRQS